VDPVLKFVIEAACLVGTVLLGAVSTPFLGGKRWGWVMWLRSAAVVVVGLFFLFVNPRGWPDVFPLVLGFTAFVAAVVGLLLGLMLAWRLTHRGREAEVAREAAINFSEMGLSGVLAAGCLLAGLACTVLLAQAVADAWAYGHAPSCATASSGSCRSQADGIVVGRSSTRTTDSVRVRIGDQVRAIEIATGHDVWQTLISGEHVEITSWKGRVTAITPPGKGTMETSDAPGLSVLVGVGFVVASLLLFALMAGYTVIYRKVWRAASAGVDVDRFAA
jgi:hypothetical protein